MSEPKLQISERAGDSLRLFSGLSRSGTMGRMIRENPNGLTAANTQRITSRVFNAPFPNFERIPGWEGDAMVLRETLLQQGPEYCASLHGGRIPNGADWLQWVEMAIAKMTTPFQFSNGEWMVRIFSDPGFRVVNFWRISRGTKRRIGELEYISDVFASGVSYELYPAESRLVNSGNEYHLWAAVEPEWYLVLPECDSVPQALFFRGRRHPRYIPQDESLGRILKRFGLGEVQLDWGAGSEQGQGMLTESSIIWMSCFGSWYRLWVWSLEKGFRPGWAEVQTIKNDLIGSECEGVERICSSQSGCSEDGRVEIWIQSNAGVRLPLGYPNRWVTGNGSGMFYPIHARFSESQRAESA
jgi:hypothetical protein